MRAWCIAHLVACTNDPEGGGGPLQEAPDPSTSADASSGAAEDAGLLHDAFTPPPPAEDAAAAHDAATEPPEDAGPRFPPVSDFAMPGPFPVTSEPAGGDCTVFRPETLGEGGVRHPVIIWGNGTYTPTVLIYAGFYRHWASHGFIVAAAHTSNAGSGAEMLACLDWVEAEHARAGSPYEGRVDLANAGATGHSQGGGGALMAGRDARVRATVPIMAYTLGLGHDSACQGQQHGPMLLISAGNDTTAEPEENQRPVFEASNVPTFWATLDGADHVSIALGAVQAYLGPTTAWFRLHLMRDEAARDMFHGAACGLCTDGDWMVQRKGID